MRDQRRSSLISTVVGILACASTLCAGALPELLFNERDAYPEAGKSSPGKIVRDFAPPPAVKPTGPVVAILLLSDGARQDLMECFVKQGLMPNVKRLFYDQGWVVEHAVTIWPSSSIPGHTSITTAAYPDKTGILGQRWFDPQKKYYRNYIGPGTARLHGDMAPDLPTVFERVRAAGMGAVSILELTSRGAGLFLPGRPIDGDSIANLKRVIGLGQAGGKLPLLRAAANDSGTGLGFVPRFIMVNLPEVDHVHHRFPTSSAEIRKMYEDLDSRIGDVAQELLNRGLLDRAYIALIADHGMSDVSRSVSLQDVLKDAGIKPYLPPRTSPYEMGNTEGVFATIRPDVCDAFVCWGGNADVLLYLKGRGKDGPEWPGVIDEAWLQNYPSQDGKSVDLLSVLIDTAGVGIVAFRAAPGTFRFETRNGCSELRGSPARGWSYAVVKGKDPFGYDAGKLLPHLRTSRTEAEWLEITAASDCPLAPVNIARALSHPSRSPAMAVIAQDGFDFIPAFLKTSIAGSHGGVTRKHVVVPFMIRGPGLTPNRLPTARTVDMVPTLLGLIGVPIPAGRIDGVDLGRRH